MVEKWDLFDKNRNSLKKIHLRGNAFKEEEYHIVVDIWTVNSNNEILLTLRDSNKRMYPDLWENTGGAVLSGETSRDGAVRELYEETGIKAAKNELFLLGSKKSQFAFYDIYVIKKDLKLSDLQLQEGETVDSKWVSLNELDKMIKDGSLAPPVFKRLSLFRNKFESYILKDIINE